MQKRRGDRCYFDSHSRGGTALKGEGGRSRCTVGLPLLRTAVLFQIFKYLSSNAIIFVQFISKIKKIHILVWVSCYQCCGSKFIEFGSGSGTGYTINFERKNSKQFEKNNFPWNKYRIFFLTIRTNCHLKKIFLICWVSELLITVIS